LHIFAAIMPHLLDKVEAGENKIAHLLLHSPTMHIVLFVLLVVDGAICFICGVLETQYLQTKVDDCTAYVDTCVTSHHRRLGGVVRQLGGSSSDPADLCNGHPHFGNHALHEAEFILACISAGILTLFLLEQFGLMLALKREYFRHKALLLDFFVISFSLALEIFVLNMTIGGLLVLARAWRFARVGHGVFEGQEKIEEIEFEEHHEHHEVHKDFSMAKAFPQLSGDRWNKIRQMNAKELGDAMSSEEKELVQKLIECPAVALRSLAVAEKYASMLPSERKRVAKEGDKGKDLGSKV
jgi:hypothetical protein